MIRTPRSITRFLVTFNNATNETLDVENKSSQCQLPLWSCVPIAMYIHWEVILFLIMYLNVDKFSWL